MRQCLFGFLACALGGTQAWAAFIGYVHELFAAMHGKQPSIRCVEGVTLFLSELVPAAGWRQRLGSVRAC